MGPSAKPKTYMVTVNEPSVEFVMLKSFMTRDTAGAYMVEAKFLSRY